MACPNDWHFVHLGARASGGAGLVFTEAVHTEACGRITRHCLGLWNDEQRDALKRIASFVADRGATPGIQLGHAGRKASVGAPWEGTKPVPESGRRLERDFPLPAALMLPAGLYPHPWIKPVLTSHWKTSSNVCAGRARQGSRCWNCTVRMVI